MAGIPSSPTDRKNILDCMVEISSAMTRIDAEREYIKEAINETCEKYELSKKTFRRMVKVYHKQNFNSELEQDQEFESMYETITKTTTMSKDHA